MSDDTANLKKRSGQVRHDAGGRAIWEWAMESGRHAIDSTSRLLKRLDLSGLSLVDDSVKHWERDNPDAAAAEPPVRKPERQQSGAAPALQVTRQVDPQASQGKSFNPYDTRAPARRAAARPSPPPRPRITQPVRPSKQPGLLARLFGRGKH